jgi:hypothetical protein
MSTPTQTPGMMGGMPEPPLPPANRRLSTSLILGIITLIVVLILGATGIIFFANRGSTAPATPGPTPTIVPTHGPTPVAVKVTSIDMVVNPQSISGTPCGTHVLVTYTATFHALANNPGGTVQFNYSVNGGRIANPGSITFNPGETAKTYTFTWSGQLSPYDVYPGQGGVVTTSPNQVISPMVQPTGTCTQQAAFKVTSITMTANPTTISNLHCGIPDMIFYTVTFNVPANSPGGTIQFGYGVNDGKNVVTTPASVTLAPGQTSKTYNFQWNGAFVAGQQYSAGVVTGSPNVVNASINQPTGTCIP